MVKYHLHLHLRITLSQNTEEYTFNQPGSEIKYMSLYLFKIPNIDMENNNNVVLLCFQGE